MKHVFILLISILQLSIAWPKEGMWVPIFLQGVIMDDMRLNGLQLSAEEIYSVNNSSLKDAVVLFGGGCTAELISNDGLLLTNHHCGYGTIQSHSSLENDYLTNGFWAPNRAGELVNPGLKATIIKRIEDVTDRVLEGVVSADNRDSIIQINIQKIIDEQTKESHYGAFVKEFYNGNQFIVFITETFTDVRLVGAPPSSIGKYGFDTDNWVWPRHTGDFSIFRIYADKDNKPAAYNEGNVPYHPAHHLPISMKGYNEGDFTMVYGFPYRTEEYLTSSAVDFIMNVSNPKKIEIRTAKLDALNERMRADDLVRIKYAAKQSSTSNAWKKWKGQNKGLQKNQALKKKLNFETEFKSRISAVPSDYGEVLDILDRLHSMYASLNKVGLARDHYVEIGYYGTDLLRFAYGFIKLENKISGGELLSEEDKEKLQKRLAGFYKNYDYETDKDVFTATMPIYWRAENNKYKPDILNTEKLKKVPDPTEWAEKTYSSSILGRQEDFQKLVDKDAAKAIKSLSKDPIFMLAKELSGFYSEKISPRYSELSDSIAELNRQYMRMIREVFPERNFYPDANGTLRMAYGKVEGMNPVDAVSYTYYTSLEGVMEKYVPGSDEYSLPDKLIELYENKDYGKYAQDGELRICFIASNHTSGGNSGSPVLNGKGELIGLNFDRNWEGTMSDIMYDINQCRNISVDIRYVLFIIDKFADSAYLLKEMTIVEQ